MIAISACLKDIKVKYNGTSNGDYLNSDNYLLICPEAMIGTPRNPVEIQGQITSSNTYQLLLEGKIKVVDKEGNDYSKEFIDGANHVLATLKNYPITKVILKAKSPSCGLSHIYDGSFSKNLIEGSGILASLLVSEGYDVEEI